MNLTVNKFGVVLQQLMEEKNLSSRELAAKISLPAKTVSEWVGDGGRIPRNPEHLKRLSDFFSISVHYLLFGQEDPKTSLGEIVNGVEIHSGLYEITIKKVSIKK
ncbi:MAG: helix-turn-helix transcriptional regulator [Deltaproteobacteria bacterium]|nr:helix-turn-helix transcriptional regulator [Deltaproteobacteria bacterium]